MAGDDSLIDPSLLAELTPEQREEALAAAAAARRAEERAEQRALERAMAQKEAQRKREQQQSISASNGMATLSSTNPQIKFVSKRARQKNQMQNGDAEATTKKAKTDTTMKNPPSHRPRADSNGSAPKSNWMSEKERQNVRRTYLGKTATDTSDVADAAEEDKKKKRKKDKGLFKKGTTFRFEWDNTDDTLDQNDPLYAPSSRKPAAARQRAGIPRNASIP